MTPLLRRLYPYAAFGLVGLLLLIGDGALLVMGIALAIAGIPLGFAPEADEIARRIQHEQADAAARELSGPQFDRSRRQAAGHPHDPGRCARPLE